MSRPNTSPVTHNFEPLPADSPPSYNEIMGAPPQHNVMPMPTAAYPVFESTSAIPMPVPSAPAPALEPNMNLPPAGPIGFVIPEKPIVTSQPMTSFPQPYEHDGKMNLDTSAYRNTVCNDTRHRNQNDTSSNNEDCDWLACCQTTFMCCLCCSCLCDCLHCIAKCLK